MITREQIEDLRVRLGAVANYHAHRASFGGAAREQHQRMETTAADAYRSLYGLALQTLDQEADAKLGRAVREAWKARSVGDAAQAGSAVYRIACERFVGAVATHLREESKS